MVRYGSLLIILLVGTQALGAQSCENPHAVLRIDEAHQHMYLVTPVENINSPKKAYHALQPLAAFVQECRPAWKGAWGASFFAEAKYAFSKHEIEDKNPNYSVKDWHIWEHSYVGSYHSRDHKLWLHPFQFEKKQWIEVVLTQQEKK